MKNIITLGLGLALVSHSETQAANLGLITYPPNALNLLVLIMAIVGVIWGIKILSLVRGGSMAKGWQLFVAGFFVLVLGQLASVLGAVELIELPIYVVPSMLAFATGLLLYGIFEVKRVLT